MEEPVRAHHGMDIHDRRFPTHAAGRVVKVLAQMRAQRFLERRSRVARGLSDLLN
jgi:hypothetical protein